MSRKSRYRRERLQNRRRPATWRVSSNARSVPTFEPGEEELAGIAQFQRELVRGALQFGLAGVVVGMVSLQQRTEGLIDTATIGP